MSSVGDRLTRGTMVNYHGSLVHHYGVYFIAGDCCCRDCVAAIADDASADTRYALGVFPDAHPEDAELTHVRRRSITPEEA